MSNRKNSPLTKWVLILSILFSFSTSTTAFSSNENPVVKLETTYGDIIIELYPKKAPITVANFLKYVDESFYDNTLIHRVFKNTFIQGGGFEKDLIIKKTHPPIKNEATNKLNHIKGSVAMARTTIIDSATSHFFINLKENEEFNHIKQTPKEYGYAVFGHVIDGINVALKISRVQTQEKGLLRDLPIKEVVILKLSRIN